MKAKRITVVKTSYAASLWFVRLFFLFKISIIALLGELMKVNHNLFWVSS